MKNVVDALTAPDKNLSTYLNRTAGSFVPNFLRQSVGPLGNDEQPDLQGDQTGLRGMLNAIKAGIPGASDTLPLQRNILGELIQRPSTLGADTLGKWSSYWMPVAYRESSDNLVTTEMSNLSYPFSPPRRNVDGVDLTVVPSGDTTAYDRYGELQGTVSLNGMTLKDALRRKILSPEYQSLTQHIQDGNISPRAEELNNIIQAYRRRAWTSLLRETPALQQHDQVYTANKHILRHGGQAQPLPSILPGG